MPFLPPNQQRQSTMCPHLRVFKRRNGNKTFLRVLPTRWRRQPAGIDMERNYVIVAVCIHREAEKGTTFLLRITLLTHNVIWQNLVLLLLVNIIVDVTYLISWIYINFGRLLCKKWRCMFASICQQPRVGFQKIYFCTRATCSSHSIIL